MTRRTAVALAVLSMLVLAGSSRATESPAPEVKYPDTAPGRHAAAYFPAYNSGSEDAMKQFYEKHVSAGGLKNRPVADRLNVLRGMREEHGNLTPLRVMESEEASLTLLVRTQRGIRLSMAFLCEEAPPHALMGIRVQDVPDEDATGGNGPEPAAEKPKSDAELVAAVRAYLEALSRDDGFSGAVLLAKGTTPLFREAYGYASREDKTPNRPDTKFNLGSINKTFTELAIQQLAAEGKLKLGDTIDRTVPEYPADKGRRITIQQLVDHRGGVPDIFGPAYDAADRTKLREIKDWIPLFADQPLHFDPGSREEYSNGGYVLLGRVIETVSKQSYYDYVRQRIFKPAGMDSTDSYAQDAAIPNRATPYTRRFKEAKDVWKDASPGNPARGSSAGGGYSTTDDLLRFVTALRENKLGAGSEHAGGLGIAGGSPGTNALLESQGDYTLVVLANMDPPAAERLGSKIRGWLPSRGEPAGAVIRRIHAGSADDPARKPRETSLPPAGVDVPMLHSGHLPAVQVMLGGQGPFLFAIDTGAAGVGRIDPALASKLGLETVGEAHSGDPSGKNMQVVPLVALDSIELGGARFTGLTVSVRPGDHAPPEEKVDGILGFGLFADCLFTLDYPAGRIRLARGELPSSGEGLIPYTDARGIPSVRLKVGSLEVDADVDAGAMGGFSLPESVAGKLSFASEPKVVGRARTANNTFEIKAATLDGDITLGGLVFSKPTVDLQPLFPMANVGSRVLRDFRVTFDQKNRRLKLERGSS